jgi:hypothetical protein
MSGPVYAYHTTPIDVTAERIAAPTPGMLADVNAVYRLEVAPFTRYHSDGAALVMMSDSGGAAPPGEAALPLSGGAMTGPLYLNADPVDAPDDSSDLLATTRHYVDAGNNLKQNTWGVSDGSDAAVGDVGEYLVSANAEGVTLPNNTPAAVCSLDLTPGDWEIWGTVDFRPAAGVSPNAIAAAISTRPDALPSDEDLMTGVGVLNMFATPSLTSGQRQVLMTGTCRSNSAAALTLYLVGQTTLGGTGTLIGKGYICARRVR